MKGDQGKAQSYSAVVSVTAFLGSLGQVWSLSTAEQGPGPRKHTRGRRLAEQFT